MAVTSIGIFYAKNIHNGTITWPDDVPVRRRKDTYDSYIELDYTPRLNYN